MTQPIRNISFKGTKTTRIIKDDNTIRQNPKVRGHGTKPLYDSDCCQIILWMKSSDINPFKTMHISGDTISIHFKDGLHIESTPTFIKQSSVRLAKAPDGTPIKIISAWHYRVRNGTLAEKVARVNQHLIKIAKKVSLKQMARKTN